MQEAARVSWEVGGRRAGGSEGEGHISVMIQALLLMHDGLRQCPVPGCKRACINKTSDAESIKDVR